MLSRTPTPFLSHDPFSHQTSIYLSFCVWLIHSFSSLKTRRTDRITHMNHLLSLALWAVISHACCSSLHNMMLLRGGSDTNSASTLQPAVGIETCRWGKERRGGCENFLKLFAVSSFRTWWSPLVEIEKLLFCISSNKKWLVVYLNSHNQMR